MFTIFSCSFNVTVTSQNGTVFSLASKNFYVMGLFTHLNNLIFIFVALKWLKTSIETLK